MFLSDLNQISAISVKKDKAHELDHIASCGPIYVKLLNMIFDKDVRYFIDTDKIKVNNIKSFCFDSDDEKAKKLYDLLNLLSSGSVRGNDGIILCSNFADQYLDTSAEVEMFKNILDNKLRLGIGATDVNKLCKNLSIEQFEVMFALQWDKAKPKWNNGYYAQPKIDGMRCIGIKKEGVLKFYTRTGKDITSLEWLARKIEEATPGQEFVLDGEIENGTLEETGVIRRKDEQAEEATYTIFGKYNLYEWETKKHTIPYEYTYIETDTFVKQLNIQGLRMIPNYRILASNEDEFHKKIQEYTEIFIEQGYEGSVLKTMNHVYNPSAGTRRSPDWIKVKPHIDADGIIIAIEEGEGLHRGMVGRFLVEWPGGTFDVAPGKLSHDARKHIWENPKLYIDQKIEFRYQLLSIYGVPRHAFCSKIRGSE